MKKKTLLTGILTAAMLFATGGLSTVYGSETKTLADYPQYNEIVQKYYEGASAGWDIVNFRKIISVIWQDTIPIPTNWDIVFWM